ncbi:undecaprenyl/decaprenyl-phosphate alpha-N-acetylglucosaminyl 1-phosphate transferase [Patescibacteria group bacterium]|nr:undecaprenyl/decaprenyl-phosphate alpha-N-acetylglucosaminyl 1-phosphate transferase [Patescibacteria group bacterium]
MNAYDFIFALAISFFSGLIFTAAIMWIARKFNVLDIPNSERKIHKKPVPLWGGIAVFLAFNFVVLLYTFFSNDLTGDTVILKNILGICLGTLFLSIGGALDDKYNLKPRRQIIWPILAVGSIIVCGIGIDWITNPFGDGVLHLNKFVTILFWFHGFPYKLTLLADIFTLLWLMSMMYTTKLLDGLDGLVSGITIIGAIFIFLTALNKGDIIQYDIALLAMIIGGIFFGFLVFNFNPANIFLGEGGSTMAGFLLGSLSILSGSKVGITLMLLSIPALDMIWTIIRRISEGHSPFSSADRKHLHHRLLDAGFSVKQAVLFLYSITVVFGIIAYSLQDMGMSALSAGFIAVITFMLILAYIYKMRREKEKALTLRKN